MGRLGRVAGGGLTLAAVGSAALLAADRYCYGGGPDDCYSEDAVSLASRIPLRTVSRAVGAAASLPIPAAAREPLFRAYCGAYGCNLDEVECDGALRDKFPSLGAFFVRSWKDESRPWDVAAAIASPCDGKLVSCGEVGPGGVIGGKVKGRKFGVRELLGAQDDHEKMTVNAVDVADRASNATRQAQKDKRLYFATIYLSPGDFHRFSCPIDLWSVKRRRHITGTRLPVHAGAVARVPDLFATNERVSWLGTWTHGMFSFVAVGALNVGSIEMTLEGGQLTGPAYGRDPLGTVSDEMQSYRVSREKKHGGLPVKRGAEVGAFHFGSSIVLVFEAPSAGVEFVAQPGDTLRVGQALFRISE